MTTHTPGPWSVDSESGNDGEAEVIVAASRTICWTADTFDDDEGAVITDEDRANGKLIAASPDLLAALKNALAEIWMDDDPAWAEGARAAIAKAEGRLP